MIGKKAPIIFEIITTKTRVTETVMATFKGVFVKDIILRKLIAARTMATINEIRNSFLSILKVSFILTSPNAKARTTMVEDCAPAFPPVSISIGINEESITTDCSTSS